MPIYLTNPKPRSKDVIKTLLGGKRVVFVDIGAGGGIKQEWHPLADVAKFVGFDGSKERIEEIRQSGFDCDLYDQFIDAEEGEALSYNMLIITWNYK